MSQFFNPTGYNKADAQFHEHDEQLLKELRNRVDQRRQETAQTQANNPHWMRCPKCGGAMNEVKYEKVNIDQCTACGGVFFDPGELAILIGPKSERGKHFLQSLFSWLPRYDEAANLLWGKDHGKS